MYYLKATTSHHGRDHMAVGFITTCAIRSYHHLVVISNTAHGEVYLIQHYVIKFVSDLIQHYVIKFVSDLIQHYVIKFCQWLDTTLCDKVYQWLDTTLCDKVCQWLAAGQRFSQNVIELSEWSFINTKKAMFELSWCCRFSKA